MSTLKIHLTYQCTGACDHCRFACQQTPREVIDGDLALDCIRTLKKIHALDTVVLLGGEPGLFPQVTWRLASGARELDTTVRVETNASWAVSAAAARQFLEPLCREHAHVCFSLDAFHERFIPPERVEQAVKVCDELGGSYSFEAAYLDRKARPAVDVRTDEIIAGLEARAGHALKVYRGPVIFCGRAAERLAPLVAKGRGVPGETCQAVPWWAKGHLRTLDLITLDPRGDLSKGCGIVFGNVRQTPLEEVLKTYDAEKHPIFSVLLESGPLGLARQAEALGYRPKDDYADRCHLCEEARAVLQAKYPEYLIPY
ncbi:MAG: hypothetical protein MUP47_07355 [Phycisphaerae bacterium]|nr:hypothetical protein [Phycisphaerae bacterium]